LQALFAKGLKGMDEQELALSRQLAQRD